MTNSYFATVVFYVFSHNHPISPTFAQSNKPQQFLSLMPRFLLFTLAITLYLSANIYTTARLCRLLPGHTLMRIAVILLFALGILSLIVYFSAGERLPIRAARYLYTYGTSWLIILLYLFMAVLFLDTLRLVNHFLHFANASLFQHNRTTACITLGAVALALISGNITYRHKRRTHIEIRSEKISTPLRIVGISDLHLGYTISAREAAKWGTLINAESPDMVIIAGDIIDNSVRPLEYEPLEEIFSNVNAPLGIFGCMGNHDLFNAVQHPEIYKRLGIEMLRDSSTTIGEITIIGRDDASNRKRQPLKTLMAQIESTTFTLLLDHQPLFLDSAALHGVDLQFSGHTHYGQVFPINALTRALFRLAYDYMRQEQAHFYVSSGIGVWGGKFRIGSRSEFVVFDIIPSEKSQKQSISRLE